MHLLATLIAAITRYCQRVWELSLRQDQCARRNTDMRPRRHTFVLFLSGKNRRVFFFCLFCFPACLTSPLNHLTLTGAQWVPGSKEVQRTAEGQQKQVCRQGQSKWTARDRSCGSVAPRIVQKLNIAIKKKTRTETPKLQKKTSQR